MPGKLGTCPTCKKEISTSAKSCLYCGENCFTAIVPDKENPVTQCSQCKGEQIYKGHQCGHCQGTGAVQGLKQVDLRTGEASDVTGRIDEIDFSAVSKGRQSRPRPESWDSNSGCAIMAAAILSAVGMIVIAIVL